MEFFVWCWIWDRRLLCGLYGKVLFTYLWIVPIIISTAVLPYALLQSYREECMDECNSFTAVKDEGEILRVLIYIEEGIILLSIFTSIGMIFQTKSLLKKLITEKKDADGKGSLDTVTQNFDYCWEVRDRSLKSCIGYTTLIIGAINYGFSIVFIN